MKQSPRILPGDLAIWCIIFAELLVFGIFFVAYAVVRINNLEMFNQYQLTLNKETGLINTILLITASYFVVCAIKSIKKSLLKQGAKLLYAAVACGALFILIKSIEFNEKFAAGIDLSTNTFYMFYLALTMFHYFHVILGVLILLLVAYKTQQGHINANNRIGLESAGAYWHMVDLVWIILFPLIYIIR